MSYVYLIQNLDTFKYKIGISKHPEKRLKQIQTGSGEELELVHQFKSKFSRKVETALHNRYGHLNTRGEWFDLQLKQELRFIKECTKIEKSIQYLKDNENFFI